ncbi:hypothetical protein FE236_00320 [Mariprofundus erugo]|uniref:hypothetical protein n=1 Tax=Mariprofundus erugo TaxID=2528639 RepID=UPI0010FE5129|nr:hypothetical protein [Mariprofundus erugo]TLS78238.1 hypothetical protein FE236_00320 [Mariprofundus erugo]
MAMIGTVNAAQAADPQPSQLTLYEEGAEWMRKCPNWVDAVGKAALDAKRFELQWALENTGTVEQKKVDKQFIEQRLALVGKETCDSEMAKRARNGINRLMLESRSEMTSRVVSLAKVDRIDLGKLTASSVSLERDIPVFDNIMAKNGLTANWQAMKQKHANEAMAVFTLACNYRVEKKGQMLRCPPMREPLGDNAIYANVIMDSAEIFAGGFDAAYKAAKAANEAAAREANEPGGTLPANQYSKIVPDGKHEAVACPNGTLVIKNSDKDVSLEELPDFSSAMGFGVEKMVPLYRIGERKSVGTIKYTIFELDTDGSNAFSGTEPEFPELGLKSKRTPTDMAEYFAFAQCK